jgi:hypothetical protein
MPIKNIQLNNETKRKSVTVTPATVGTSAGNTDIYTIAPLTGMLESVYFSCVDALSVHANNHVTFSITNLGQLGAGSTAMLHATKNTTDSDIAGYSAIAANTVKSLYLSTVLTKGQFANRNVVAGDRLLVRIVAAGTLANSLTYPVFCLRFLDQSVN